MENSNWSVPCDRCHKHWLTVSCAVHTVYDKLTLGGRAVGEAERALQQAKRDGTLTDEEGKLLDEQGRYAGKTCMMPRKVLRYDEAICRECKGGGRPEI